MKYTISTKDDQQFTVFSLTYDQAATIAARKLYGKKVTARRTTGDNSKSGYFQAYEKVDQGLSSYGEPFHVS